MPKYTWRELKVVQYGQTARSTWSEYVLGCSDIRRAGVDVFGAEGAEDENERMGTTVFAGTENSANAEAEVEEDDDVDDVDVERCSFSFIVCQVGQSSPNVWSSSSQHTHRRSVNRRCCIR